VSARARAAGAQPRASAAALGVGLIGFGTIGTGVVKLLQRNADVIAGRLGFPLRLVRVADLELERDRGVDLAGARFDADAEALVDDPSVDLVVELIGGCNAARRLILRALARGKPVVTANKALLALHGKEIFEAGRRGGADVAFEASVGGGIPILRSLREGLAANHILSVHGIINGTTNYVLTEMERGGEPFEVVLKRAQELGYAEADPSFDVDGVDAAHKITLLAAMAFGAEITAKQVPTEGIRHVTPLDLEAAREFGYRVKLLGITKLHDAGRSASSGEELREERIEVRVHPTMIPESSLLAKVDGAMNAIAVQGDAVGPTLFYGAGAGELPTASAVVADLIELAREVRRGSAGRVAPLSYLPESLVPKPIVPLGELFGRCYLRFTAADRPGVLSHVAGILGEHDISIESVIQKGRGAASVPIVVMTHPAREASVRSALDAIDALPEVTAPTRLVRIEEGL
jgi:homoserine dehydrogenase